MLNISVILAVYGAGWLARSANPDFETSAHLGILMFIIAVVFLTVVYALTIT